MLALGVAVILMAVQVMAMLIPQRARAGVAGLTSLASKRFPHQTEAERKLLQFVDSSNPHRGERVYAGPSANPSDPSNQSENAETWSHERDIRAEMIRWLAADPEASRRVDPVGIKVFGARVVGGLDLSHIHVPFQVALAQCSIPERINLDSTNIPFFDLAGSQRGEIFGPNLVVEGNLNIGFDNNPFGITCVQGEVFLRGAKVGGSAIFNAGQFSHSKVEPMSWGSEWKRTAKQDLRFAGAPALYEPPPGALLVAR
jgi:hypothetical protein